jgi:cytochrome P450
MTVDTPRTLGRFDFNDPSFLLDPYPTYARYRAAPGIVAHHELGWLAARHADIDVILHDRRMASAPLNAALYSALPPAAAAAIEPFQASMAHNMLFQDAPEHTRLRKLVSQAFTPRRLEQLRATITDITQGLLTGLGPGDTVDIIETLAFPLPSRVIASMLGLPWDDLDQLKRWTDDGADFLGNARTATEPVKLAERTGASYTAIMDYFREQVACHRADPGDDLICAMLAVEDEGQRLTEEELLSTCGLLFSAGHETTTNLIGNGLLALLRHPSQLQILRERPDLVPAAVDELCRFDSPVQYIYRVSLTDVTVGTTAIPAGQLVTLLLGAGNRDPLAFPDPDQLDVTRRPRHYLSFGTGAHACLGGFLARLEASIALGQLLDLSPGLRLADDSISWRPNPIFRGLERLCVSL